MENRMKNKHISLRERLIKTTEATPESISCSGNYGTGEGWRVSCRSTNPRVPEIGTVYQPYPESCQALPETIGGGHVAGSGQR